MLLAHVHPSVLAVRWRCFDFACYIGDLNPYEPDLSTVRRIPKGFCSVYFINLNTSSLNVSVLEQQGLIVAYTTISNSPVRSILLPSHVNVPTLVIEQSNLTEITFEANNTFLEKITIRNGSLENIPATLVHLAAVRYVTIGQNPIQTVDLNLFASLPRLESLDLSTNSINHLHYSPVSHEDFPFLQEVYLSQNRLTVVNLNYFSNMVRLETIYLSNNLIKHVEGALVLDSLKFLDMSHNSIAALDCCQWNTVSLISLSLQNNTLEELPPGMEVAMPAVKYLHLSQNVLTGRDMWRRLISLQYLQALHLNSNRLTSVKVGGVFPSLFYLHLDRNLIKHLQIPFATGALSVTAMCNLIEQFEPKSMSPNVTYLNMDCNPFGCKGQAGDSASDGSRAECVKHDDRCKICYT
uniref:Leucine rich immune protein (Coil-less) n=1 Tax=Anopheles epiroticus TaxID=199890 RepID=A0A240PM51_9DIPT